MPLKNPYQATLLLDLDETTFIALSESEFDLYGKTNDSVKSFKRIHPSHTLSNHVMNSGYYFFVINPEKLKTMIETIYEQNDDIVIFTAGLWLKPVLSIISQLCSLSDAASLRFNQALFLNPQHDSEKLSIPINEIRTLLKGYRLHGLFRPMPELRGKHFILLDNDRNHIASCESCFYLEGVVATTDIEDMSFYDLVLKKMELAHKDEAQCSPSSSCYHYPEPILRTFIEIESRPSQESVARNE